MIGYATENKEEYNKMSEDPNNKHIIFTDRENIPDMKPIKDTLNTSQVQGQLAGNNPEESRSFHTLLLPCSCPQCCEDPSKVELCLFKKDRKNCKQKV